MRERLPSRNHRLPEISNPSGPPAIEYVLSPETEEPRLRDYWKMLFPRWRLIMVISLVVLGIGAAVTFRMTQLYTASATVQIDSPTPPVSPVIGGGEAAAVSTVSDDYFRTQIELLKGRALAAQVIQNLGLERNPNFVVSANPLAALRGWLSGNIQAFLARFFELVQIAPPPRQTSLPSTRKSELNVHPRFINRYLSLLTVTPLPRTQLVKISFSTVDPAFSEELANAHADAFIRKSLETRFELTKEAREFLDKKLVELKAKVAQAEEALNRFRKTYGVVSVEGNENIVLDRMMDLNRRLTEARAKRIELESLSKITKDRNFGNLSQIIDNNLIMQLRGKLETLEAEQARLATIFKNDHPRILELNNQVNQARQRLNLEIRNVVRAIESDFAAARAKEAALQAESERQQQSALQLKELAVQHTLLQGELDGSRTIYANVLKRLNETSVSSDSPLSNIQIVEPAERPLGPSSPQIERNLMLASVLGLFLGVGVAFLLEYSNSALRTPDEVWRAVAVPTLGSVPHWRSLRRREYGLDFLPKDSPLRYLAASDGGESQFVSHTLVASHHPFSLISESYRAIRSGLLLAQRDPPPQVVLVTSARPGEGKTSVTLNLAITLAQSGRKVVVIDADLRAGNCHALLGLNNRYGLVQLLNDDLPLDIVLQRTAVDGLYFIPRGMVPHNPTDLLASERMAEVIQTLREQFDLVLIDSPPAIAVSDAIVLAVQCDGVILVLRAYKTPPAAVQRVIERLETVGSQILGTVLIGVDFRTPDFADYHEYYKSYYSAAHKGTKEQS
jgi:succinoglycan biosynthesis transport protein ExoP